MEEECMHMHETNMHTLRTYICVCFGMQISSILCTTISNCILIVISFNWYKMHQIIALG